MIKQLSKLCHIGFTLYVWMLVVTPARAAATQEAEEEFAACAQFQSADPQYPVTETVRVTIRNRKSPIPPELRLEFAEQLAFRQLWNAKGVITSTLEAVDELCPSSVVSNVQADLNLSAQDIASIQAGAQRGSLAESIKSYSARFVSAVRPPSKPARGVEWVRVYFATNRELEGAARDALAKQLYRTGAVDVAIASQARMEHNRTGGLVRIERVTDYKDIVVGSPHVLTLSAWKDELRRRQGIGKVGTLVFIHGYRTSFETAAKRTAQLAYDLAYPGPAVFFSWPSADRVTSYASDAREARASGTALSAMLEEVSDGGPIHIVAHSMGNLVLLDALLKLRENAPEKMGRIEEVVLAAPDVDTQEFTQNFAPKLLTGKPRYTLYASEHDMALASAEAFQGGQRLGVGGRGLYVRHFLDSVDASAVPRAFFDLNHSYFGDTTTVMSDLFYLIRYRLKPEERKNLRKIEGTTYPAWRFRALNE